MLQQTTVKTVIPYYDAWFNTFPTVRDLANAKLQKVLQSWQGLGYYQRARNLHRTAKVLVRDHQGEFPRDPLIVRSFPGFGPYTTGAVLSIAFGLPIPIIDANIRRVVRRVLGLKAGKAAQIDAMIYQFLSQTLPSKRAGCFNQALMELGALICRQRAPDCSHCPLQQNCLAFKKGWQDFIPGIRKKKIETISAVVGIIEKGGKYFIQQRSEKGLLAGLWEFPGGKVKKGETAVKALGRELREEIGVRLISAHHLIDLEHFYTRFRVHLRAFISQVEPLPEADPSHRWVLAKDFKKYPMPSANARIVARLQNGRA